MEQIKNKRYFELDALRGIAALLVVLFHFTLGRKESQYGFRFGSTGVDLFFIISGFVILLTIEKTKSAKEFIINRFSRLYPTYWTCVTLTTSAIVIGLCYQSNFSPKIIGEYFANMTMFQIYFKYGNIDGSYWTMIIEMLFYIYMLIIFLTNKIKHVEIISLCLLIPIAFYDTNYFRAHFGSLSKALSYWLPLINHFPLFCAGIVFYKMKFDKKTALRHLFLIICFCCQLRLFDNGGKSSMFMSLYEYMPVLAFYFIVFYLYISDKLNFIVSNVTIFLGNISFSLYLIHQEISTKFILPYLTKHSNFFLACLVTLLLMIFLSFLINRFIEKPVMKYIRSRNKSTSKL
jgi:peptidoglycan/LPS O-acetylase OafA/YrhL